MFGHGHIVDVADDDMIARLHVNKAKGGKLILRAMLSLFCFLCAASIVEKWCTVSSNSSVPTASMTLRNRASSFGSSNKKKEQ